MINLKILYLESNEDDAARVQASLAGAASAFNVHRVSNADEYRQQLKTLKPDLVLCSWQAGDIGYTAALKLLRAEYPNCPFILLAGAIHEAAAITTLKHGVDDYLLTDRLLRLPVAITSAVTRTVLVKQNSDADVSEQRLLALIENSGEIVSVAGLDGEIIYTSANVTRVLGYSKRAYINARFDPGFIHPDDRAKQETVFKHTRETPGEVHAFTWRLKHAKGHWVWVAGTVTNLLHVEAIKGVVANFKDVSDQKAAEERLALSEQRYRNIVETAQEGIWVLDEHSVTVFVNKKMCDMLGYPAEDIMGKPNYDFKDEYEKQLTINRVAKRKKGLIETHESTFVTKSGGTLICRVSTNSIFDAVGSFVGTLAMITDITELKAQQEALQRSQANLSAVIENTNDLVYSLDKDLRFITFNKRFKEAIKMVYGFDTEYGVSAMSLIATLSEQAGQEWKAIYALALTGETQQFVNEYPVPDGKVYLSYSVNPIRDGDEVIGLSVFSRDITQRRADELALIQSEANLRSVFENTDLAIVLYDPDLLMISFNTTAAMKTRRLLGKELEVGHSAFEYFREERWDMVKDVLKRIKQGEVISYELKYHMLDGHQEWLESRWFGVTNQQQEIVGVILTLKNITDQKQAELERETMTADILRRNRHLEQFTYIISHNVRAPVANIKGLTELLINTDAPETPTEPIVAALSTSADQLDKVIIDLNQILQVDKQLHENKQRVPLHKLIEQVKLELQAELSKYNVTVDEDFNAVPELFTVKSYIYSIFHNLITNSIKYRREGADPEISIWSAVSGDKILIWFEDKGRGIDLERYGNDLFGLYKRFDFSVEGKGMGLFMVKQQVQSLGGNISVSSQPGKGTKFELEFPL